MIKLSILIPTHNRPLLFQRALESALSGKPDNVEIIVNNDTRDVTERKHVDVTYHYRTYKHLSSVYKFLLRQSEGQYIYFLEDDDYLKHNFYPTVMPLLEGGKYDMVAGNYYPTWNEKYVPRYSTVYNENKPFRIDSEALQLSQFVFKRDKIVDFPFPRNSHIHNDQRLVEHAVKNSDHIKTTSNVLYYQTTDGGDNISFPESPNYYGL